jgi:hypothetical protein
MTIKRYVLNLLVSLDQGLNTIIAGAPDETISSRCCRGYGKHWYWTGLGKFLNWLDPNHIQDALRREQEGAHHPQ